ncbi:protein OBERON 4 [Euphorbia lathyris]|uniref:protein OBERON 4 n=1 Tax=Euphorbia lathyris TaxID=212925 RepID=UPI003313B7EC
MKRLRSTDDLDSYNEKSSAKDSNPSRSSRSFYYKSDNVRKGLMSTSSSSGRYDRDRSLDDDNRENSRMVRKRADQNFDSFDRRKGIGLGFDRYSSREGHMGSGGGGTGAGSGSGSSDRNIHRSESFCGSRREFPKGFRSERDRSRREGSVSSWRKFGAGTKEFEEIRSSRGANEDRLSAASRSSPKGLRDVKSPTWSRDSGSEQSRVGRGTGRDDGKGRSSTPKSRSSPTWSKDSGSEQSKSVEVGKKMEQEVKNIEMEAKSVEMEVKSVASGSSSEMEEGELEPEPEPEPEPELVSKIGKELKTDDDAGGKHNTVSGFDNGNADNETEVKETEKLPDKRSVSMEKELVKKVDKMPNCDNLNRNTSLGEDEVKCVDGDEKGEEVQSVNEHSLSEEIEHGEVAVEKAIYMEEENKREKGIDLQAKVEDDEVPGSKREVKQENGMADVSTGLVTESLFQNLKDKGKSIVVSPTIAIDSAEDSAWIERESRDLATSRDGEDDMEGPSTRGFELFSSSPAEKAEQSGASKPRDEKLVLEPLDLSLSLPNVLLPIGASRDAPQAPGSPSHGRSVQSFSTFLTNSDGFTGSMSFSGSQSYFHNPSCSLTQNSLDMDNYEQSVHSRPIFQGIDQGNWQGQAQNDSKPKDVPLYQRVLMNGNGSLQQSQVLQGVANGQALQGSSKVPNGLERQLSFHKQLSGKTKNPEETRSPSQSVGSHDIGSNYSLDKKRTMREKHGSSLYRSNSQKEQEQFLIGGADFVETIISRIVSDPIHVMARKFHEMTAQSASLVKESIREVMLNADKQGQLYAYQSVLQNRSDLTLDMLLKSHRFQLEILVALKTGLWEYLQVDSNISSSDLAEIFLNLRCRNHSCRNPLPVDECDCKVCVKKNGFCSACMCLVCSKFDMAYQTCSWVGCDVCLHWCHADCALRESYIRNGRSVTGTQGTTEVQFHCVACDHPSEMFGFVKEVFQNFAKTWTTETFSRELEYVKRIFSASKDFRGRRLHEIADRMLEKLAIKSNLPEVYTYIMGFLTESDPSKFGNPSVVLCGKEQGNGNNGGASRDEATWMKSVYTEKGGPQMERSSSSLVGKFDSDLNEKGSGIKEAPVFEELESIVRIKHAEAKMFQARADDARREAEGLKRIAIAKNEKIEEEYKSRIGKLRIMESEEMRKEKYEEFQGLERAHREYLSMKMRMEAEIKDLLSKMEATKRNFGI